MLDTQPIAIKIAKVLLVEDDPLQVKIIQMMLARHRYEVLAAANNLDAIALAHHIKPDVILVDIHLTKSSSIETIRALKDDPDLNHIPVIAMTAITYSQTTKQAYDAGCDLLVSKPVRANELLDGIQNLRFAS